MDQYHAAVGVGGVALHAILFDLPIITIGFTISDFVAQPVSLIVFPAESSLAHRHSSLLLLTTLKCIIISHDQFFFCPAELLLQQSDQSPVIDQQLTSR